MTQRTKLPVETTSQWATIGEIQRANHLNGGYWFSDGATRFFGSKLENVIYGGNWFVYLNRFTTSDGVTTDYYKVAHALPNGEVHGDAIDWSITVGLVGSSYATAGEARAHARSLEAGEIGCECVGCDAARHREPGIATKHTDLAGDLGL